MRQNDPEPSFPARSSARVPAATTAVARERRRAFKRLKLHRQFVPLLVLITLLSTAGISGLAYLGSRSAAISNAQTRAAQDARVLRDELTARGAPLRLSDGRFVVGTGPNALTLNDDTTIADQTQAMLSADSTIYELEGSRLIAVSTTVPAAGFQNDTAPNSRDLGDALPGSVTTALVGSCGASAAPSCYQSFDGIATLGGRQYITDVLPLFDANGAFVGAVGAALPMDAVLASTTQLAVMLLLVGTLLALVSLASGTWIYGARVESVLDRLDGRLNRLSDAAADLEHLADDQVDRSSRQSAMARQIAEQVRALDAMAQVMEQGHATLRDSTTAMWGEISQPGIAADSATATRLAQQTAVTASRLGSAAEDARNLCRQLVTQMNHIVAEAGIVTESGRAMEQRAKDLRACVEGVEITLGERIRKRMLGSSLPLVRRVRAASRHMRGESSQHVSSPGSSGSSFGAQPGPTSRYLPWRHTSGTLRATVQRTSSSGRLPSVSRDDPLANPAVSQPRRFHFPNDAGTSGDRWNSNRSSSSSGWLGD